MKILSFIVQSIIKPKTVGALLPSSEYLAAKMIDDINFSKAKYLIEYGPGTGVFTDKLLKMRNKDATVLLIEYNYEFYSLLKDKYKEEKNLYIIHDSAENIDKYMIAYNIPHADYVVSGLPFASLPLVVSSKILEKTRASLSSDGKFITFQYTLFKKNFINAYFKHLRISREYRNIPPAYVFNCSNQFT